MDLDRIKGDEILQAEVMRMTGWTRKELIKRVTEYYG